MRNNYIYESYNNPFANSDNYSTKKNEFETSPNGPQISPYRTFGGFNSLMHLNTSTHKPPFAGPNYPSSSSSYLYSKNYPEPPNIYEANRTKYRSPTTTNSASSALTTPPTKEINIYSTPNQINKQREITGPSTFQDQTPPKNFKPSEPHSMTFYSPSRTTSRFENPSDADQGINRPLFYNSESKRLAPTKASSAADDIRYNEENRTEPRTSISSNSTNEEPNKFMNRSGLQEHHQIINAKLKPGQATMERDKKDGIRRYLIPTTLDKNDYSTVGGIKLKNSSSPQSFSNIYPDINQVHKIFQDRYKANNFISPPRNHAQNTSINHMSVKDKSYDYLMSRYQPVVSSFDSKIAQDIEKRHIIDNARSSKPVQVENPKPKERSISPTDFGVDEEVNENDDTRPNPQNSERTSIEQPRYSLSEKLGSYSKKQVTQSSRNKISVSASKPNFPRSPDHKVLNTEENVGNREKMLTSTDRERGRSSSFDRKSSGQNKDKGMSPLREIYESTKNFLNRMVYRDRVKCNCSPNLLHDDETCTRARNWLYTKFNPNELEYLKKTYNQVLEHSEIDQKCSRQISLDIPRTFPNHKLFARDSEGSKSLERVLRTYAKYDPQIGYVQGLNFVAASVLYHAEEYITFWILVILFERIEIRDVYTRELSGVYKHGMILDALIKNRMPDLYNKMNEYGVSVQMFCIEWVCGLFGSIIPIEIMGVFLDHFIEGGWKFFYKFVISLLKEFEEVFSKTEDLSEMMIIFKNSINRGTSEGGRLKISWEKIVEDSKNVEIDADIIFKLHTLFDVETKNFQSDPSELLSKL